MVIKILIVRNTLGCRSSGISLTMHREFVKLLMIYNIKIAKMIKMEINISPVPSSPDSKRIANIRRKR